MSLKHSNRTYNGLEKYQVKTPSQIWNNSKLSVTRAREFAARMCSFSSPTRWWRATELNPGWKVAWTYPGVISESLKALRAEQELYSSDDVFALLRGLLHFASQKQAASRHDLQHNNTIKQQIQLPKLTWPAAQPTQSNSKSNCPSWHDLQHN